MGIITRRTEIIKKMLSEDDIEELYGEDQPTFEMMKTVAESEIPSEIDDIIEAGFSEVDLEFGSLIFQ